MKPFMSRVASPKNFLRSIDVDLHSSTSKAKSRLTMQTTRLPVRRILHLRPLRPPNRVFTTTSPTHTIPRNSLLRPQLPFLSSSSSLALRRTPNVLHIRPISTETRDWVVYQLKLAVYWTAMIWIFVGGCTISYFVLHNDWLSRLYPTPDDWPYFAKIAWHAAKAEEELEQKDLGGLTDWAVVGRRYKNVAAVLEEGSIFLAWNQQLPKHDDWDRTIPGLDASNVEKEPISPLSKLEKIGFDIEGKSKAWREGYFEAMMGMAKASEMMEDWVQDNKRALCFPREQMEGPSNPYPKPVWPGSPPAPKEEDCGLVSDSPKLFYTRILTTKGLSRKQKIAAGIAFASWYDFKGEHNTADALYHWALDSAVEGLPSIQATTTSISTPSFVNSKTGIIPSTAPYTTKNILTATTALASHIARHGSSSSPAVQSTSSPLQALPLYLSILRARRTAAASPPETFYPPPQPDYSLTTVSSIALWLRSLPFRSNMIADTTIGDEPYTRTSISDCEDAALMNYVGEVLYASTLEDSTSTKVSSSKTLDKRRREALSWTRDAVRIAETGAADDRLDVQGRRTCMQCLGAGLENWNNMVGALAKEERIVLKNRSQRDSGSATSKAGGSSWQFWKWGQSSGQSPIRHTPIDPALLLDGSATAISADTAELEEGEWTKEAAMVRLRLHEYQEAKLLSQLNTQISAKSNWFVV